MIVDAPVVRLSSLLSWLLSVLVLDKHQPMDAYTKRSHPSRSHQSELNLAHDSNTCALQMKWVRVKLSSLHSGYGHVGVSPPAPPLPFPADASTCYFSHSVDLTVPWGTYNDGVSSGDGFNARAAVAGLGSGYAVPNNLFTCRLGTNTTADALLASRA